MLRKSLILSLCACMLAVIPSCSNKQGPAGFNRIFERLSRAKGLGEIRQCYTAGTMSAVEAAVSSGVLSEKEKLSVFPRFSEKTKWEEMLTKVDGTKGIMRVRCIDSTQQNMIGYIIDFRLKKENGAWKVDLEDEMRAAFRDRKAGDPAGYVKRVKNKY